MAPWVPDVRRLRPEMPWQDVLAVVNSRLPDSRRWTMQRLVRAARAYVAKGLLPEAVLERATERLGEGTTRWQPHSAGATRLAHAAWQAGECMGRGGAAEREHAT